MWACCFCPVRPVFYISPLSSWTGAAGVEVCCFTAPKQLFLWGSSDTKWCCHHRADINSNFLSAGVWSSVPVLAICMQSLTCRGNGGIQLAMGRLLSLYLIKKWKRPFWWPFRDSARFPPNLSCCYLWIPEHSMQSSTPRLMEAQQGAAWPQSQHTSLPGRPWTLWRRLSPPPRTPFSPFSLGSLAESMLLVEGEAVRSKRCRESGQVRTRGYVGNMVKTVFCSNWGLILSSVSLGAEAKWTMVQQLCQNKKIHI